MMLILCHIWLPPKPLKMFTESIFDQFWWPSHGIKIDVNMCEPHYVNLFLWTFSTSSCVDIWHLFWQFDIFWLFDTLLKPHQPITGLFYGSYFLRVFVCVYITLLNLYTMWWVKESTEVGFTGLTPQKAAKGALLHPDFQNMPDSLIQVITVLYTLKCVAIVT